MERKEDDLTERFWGRKIEDRKIGSRPSLLLEQSQVAKTLPGARISHRQKRNLMKRLFGRRCQGLLRASLIGLGVFWILAARAATLTVTNLADSGQGSLRQALADNTSLGGGNTIVFSNTVTGVIPLSSAELTVSAAVTIRGPGTNLLAVSGSKGQRLGDMAHGLPGAL